MVAVVMSSDAMAKREPDVLTALLFWSQYTLSDEGDPNS